MMDRAAQKRGETYCGVRGIAMQDASVQESMGPIQDRTKENLVSTDNAIIMARHRLLKAARELQKGAAPPGLDAGRPARALGDLRAAGRCAVRRGQARRPHGARRRAAHLDLSSAHGRRSILARPADAGCKDKVCIVTGAGQGIGRATAKRLGAEGGTVVVADRVDEGATQTMAELSEHGVDGAQGAGRSRAPLPARRS